MWKLRLQILQYRQKMRFLLSLYCQFILTTLLVCHVCSGIVFSQTDSPLPLAFASDIDGDWEIYITDTTGKTPVNLTDNETADYYPNWSPDNTEIAFFSRRDGNHEIYVMWADGRHQRRLTNNPAVDKAPSWSPDGKTIAFASNRSGHFNIYILELESGSLEILTENTYVDEIPIWSPDGKRIVFQSKRHFNWDIYTINVETREEQRLTYQPLMDTYPAWSPDGRFIVYASMRQDVDQADFDLYLMDAADGGNKKVLTDTPEDEAVASWSPDGHKLAFQAEMDGRWVIHLMNVEGTERRELINNSAWAVQPKWHNPSSELTIDPLFGQYTRWGEIKTQ